MSTPTARPGAPIAPADQVAEHLAAVEGLYALLPALRAVGDRLIDVYRRGGRLYTFGNGGSAADAQHLAGELIGRYLRERRPLPAVSLVTDPTVVSCIGNDFSFDEVFARQIQALATPGDMVIAFTTSGRSPNVVRGLQEARDRGAVTVLFAGGTADGMPAGEHADFALVAPATTTARIQETHLTLLHLLSEHVDAWAAGAGGTGDDATTAPHDDRQETAAV
ncbi:SIS domain-containing protein [Streptomyces sp. DSM 41524]|uniref:SIS domain-containing protein n=1 Tax=Streptomyces asiaticus subsp. ignotus TaxID=3098222 RepID=A0ABU7PWZ6_9ACTN|nr:SIS domain-containing protein [Streptomyces sp. DASNCL29]MEE4593646.1 SIS domain-containing protein [Streptomyces sp. DSM 41524]TMU89881.1 SIS domain-containing protein [Streptomyces sp. DASNCL29]